MIAPAGSWEVIDRTIGVRGFGRLDEAEPGIGMTGCGEGANGCGGERAGMEAGPVEWQAGPICDRKARRMSRCGSGSADFPQCHLGCSFFSSPTHNYSD